MSYFVFFFDGFFLVPVFGFETGFLAITPSIIKNDKESIQPIFDMSIANSRGIFSDSTSFSKSENVELYAGSSIYKWRPNHLLQRARDARRFDIEYIDPWPLSSKPLCSIRLLGVRR